MFTLNKENRQVRDIQGLSDLKKKSMIPYNMHVASDIETEGEL